MARPKAGVVLSHWYQLIQNLQASPMEFYAAVERAVEARQIPDANRSRVDWREGGITSAKREYLRVTRRQYTFDICGAPFGTGFFVSSWLVEPEGCLTGFPFLGPILDYSRRERTYYQVDTALMFQSAVHAAVLEVVDEMIKAKGLRALSELDRKPVLRDFLER